MLEHCENVTKSSRKRTQAIVHQAQNAVYSSPYANLRESVATMKEEFSSRVEFYDPINTAMISCPEIFDATSDQISSETVLPDDYVKEIQISESSATRLFSGFAQGMLMKQSSSIVLSDKDGQVYSVSCPEINLSADITDMIPLNLYQDTDSGSYPLLTNRDGTWFLNTVLLASNFVSGSFEVSRVKDALIQIYWTLFLNNQWQNKTILQLSQLICDHITGSDYPIIQDNLIEVVDFLNLDYESDSIAHLCHILLKHFTPLQDRRAPIAYVMESTLDNTEVCSAYLDVCDALLTSKPAVAIQSIQTKYKGAKKSARNAISTLSDAFRQGGFRGVVSAMFAFFKGGTTISDDNGSLQFTNNEGLLPQEFIAGILATAISAIASVVALLVSVFVQAVGAVLYALYTVFSGIFKSFTSMHDDTYASINSSDDPDDTFIPCHPFSMFYNTVSVSSPFGLFLLRQYYKTLDCSYFSVPGGYIFFGPGDFDSAGSILSMRYEFHPYSGVFDVVQFDHYSSIARPAYSTGFTDKYGEQGDPEDPGTIVSSWSKIKQSKQEDVVTDWCSLLSSNEHDVTRVPVSNQENTGHLSSEDDLLTRASVLFNTGWFLLWYLSGFVQSEAPVVPAGVVAEVYPSFSADQSINDILYGALLVAVDGYKYDNEVPTWTDLINLGIAMSDNLDLLSVTAVYYTSDHPVYTGLGYNNFNRIATSGAAYDSMLTSQVIPLPASFYYDTKMPQYNGSTFWKWLGLTAAVTATVAVTSLIVSVKVKNFMKKKRASNKARFDSAQSDYNNALNGEIREVKYNEESGKWEEVITKVDPDSPEGKALISSTWKTYKKTARNNNLWQHIIGGSRYDVGSFWGEAAEPEGEESVSFSEKLSSLEEQEDLTTDVPAVSQQAIQDATVQDGALTRSNLSTATENLSGSISDLATLIAELSTLSQNIKTLITGPSSPSEQR